MVPAPKGQNVPAHQGNALGTPAPQGPKPQRGETNPGGVLQLLRPFGAWRVSIPSPRAALRLPWASMCAPSGRGRLSAACHNWLVQQCENAGGQPTRGTPTWRWKGLPSAIAALLLVAFGFTPSARPAEPAKAALAKPAAATSGEKITYADHVRPIFREHCFNCHNQNKATNDLALDTYERIRKGGASGDAITPGDPENSYLWNLVSHQSEPHMPPMQDKLAAAKLDLIKRWIAGGALKDSGSKADAPKRPAISLAISAGSAKPEGPPIMPEGLSHQPVVYTKRPGTVTAMASRALGTAVGRRRAKTDLPLPER